MSLRVVEADYDPKSTAEVFKAEMNGVMIFKFSGKELSTINGWKVFLTIKGRYVVLDSSGNLGAMSESIEEIFDFYRGTPTQPIIVKLLSHRRLEK